MDWKFQGYAMTTGRLIESKNRKFYFASGCFHNSVGQTVPLYSDHDASERIGSAYLEAEDEIGLQFKANFYDTKRGREIETKVKEGVLTAVSIHGRSGGHWNDDQTIRVCTRTRVLEVSIVDEGGNPEAWIAPVEKRQPLAGVLSAFEEEVQRTKRQIATMDAARNNGFYKLR